VKEFFWRRISSRKKDKKVIAAALVFFPFAVWVLMRETAEPRYQGRTLSYWLQEWDNRKSGGDRDKAIVVLTEAARNATPEFIRALRDKDSNVKLSLMRLAQRGHIKVAWSTAEIRRERSIANFSRFGPGAIPVLTNLLDDPAVAANAVRTLVGTGPQSSLALIDALGHTNDLVRAQAAAGLDSVYENSVRFRDLVTSHHSSETPFPTNPAVVALIRRLDDKTPGTSAWAAFALGNMREQPATVVPALIECLAATTNSSVRRAALTALGRYSRYASSAIPAVERLVSDTDPSVRSEAERALRKIRVPQ
jgi:HEAT repeat protein